MTTMGVILNAVKDLFLVCRPFSLDLEGFFARRPTRDFHRRPLSGVSPWGLRKGMSRTGLLCFRNALL